MTIRRCLFLTATVWSVVLCAGTAVLWMRSTETWDALLWARPHWHVSATSGPAGIWLQFGREFQSQGYDLKSGYHSGRWPEVGEDLGIGPYWIMAVPSSERMPSAMRWTGISFEGGPRTPDYPPHFHQWALGIPYGYWLALFAVPPFIVTLREARGFIRQIGHRCRTCGYDLRGSEGRCPECGTAIRVERSGERHPRP